MLAFSGPAVKEELEDGQEQRGVGFRSAGAAPVGGGGCFPSGCVTGEGEPEFEG